MSSSEFVATAAKYYIIHQIIKKVVPFVVVPLLLVFGAMPVLIGFGVVLVGGVLWIVGRVIYALCADGL